MMKKITIKHYLNTKVAPIIIYGKVEAYPLYLQFIVNRKTQQIKSLFDVYMSKKAFEEFRNGETNYKKETNIKNYVFDFDFEDEPKQLETAIRFLLDNNIKFNLKSKCFREYILEYQQRAFKVYRNEAAKIETKIDDVDDFINCFNLKEKTIIHCSKTIKEIAQTDILKYLPIDYIKIWQTVEFVKVADNGKLYFDFIASTNEIDILKTLNLKKTKKFCEIDDVKQIEKAEILEVLQMLNKRIRNSIKILFD